MVFASQKLEDLYKRLAVSQHREDRRSYQTLQKIRRQLGMHYRSGREIPMKRIPSVYKRMFDIENLWRLDVPAGSTVVYSVVRQQILIVDIV